MRQKTLDPDLELPRSALDILAQEPPQDPAMAMCLRAWNELHSERETIVVPKSEGPGVFSTFILYGLIPYRAVTAWCRDEGLGKHETAIVRSVLTTLDVARAEREQSKLK